MDTAWTAAVIVATWLPLVTTGVHQWELPPNVSEIQQRGYHEGKYHDKYIEEREDFFLPVHHQEKEESLLPFLLLLIPLFMLAIFIPLMASLLSNFFIMMQTTTAAASGIVPPGIQLAPGRPGFPLGRRKRRVAHAVQVHPELSEYLLESWSRVDKALEMYEPSVK